MHIFRVSELTSAVREALESEFPFVWVRGQVTNLARPGSGHIYFTLSDDQAQVQVVWFKANQWIAGGAECVNPVTGEVCDKAPEIDNGTEVLCAGRLSLYGPRGAFQLVAELVQVAGVGDLHLKFEALKMKLGQAGYFDEDRKMSLPAGPKRIAVVTSPTGAAIRDFLRMAGERGTKSEIRIYPVLVQGDMAPGQIANAVERIGRENWAQVAVLIRGGGSLEDLWAFNTEEVARAIYDCPVPVLTGVGHEVDTTIADYVADKRASTPTHAAQALLPLRRDMAQRVDELDNRLARAYGHWLSTKEEKAETLKKALKWLSPGAKLTAARDRLSGLEKRLARAAINFQESKQAAVSKCRQRLDNAFTMRDLDGLGSRADGLRLRLDSAYRSLLEDKAAGLERLKLNLEKLSPLEPLTRGYSLVMRFETDEVVKNAAQVEPGDRLRLLMDKGEIEAVAEKIKLSKES